MGSDVADGCEEVTEIPGLGNTFKNGFLKLFQEWRVYSPAFLLSSSQASLKAKSTSLCCERGCLCVLKIESVMADLCLCVSLVCGYLQATATCVLLLLLLLLVLSVARVLLFCGNIFLSNEWIRYHSSAVPVFVLFYLCMPLIAFSVVDSFNCAFTVKCVSTSRNFAGTAAGTALFNISIFVTHQCFEVEQVQSRTFTSCGTRENLPCFGHFQRKHTGGHPKD